jgi:hypothetical protein
MAFQASHAWDAIMRVAVRDDNMRAARWIVHGTHRSTIERAWIA